MGEAYEGAANVTARGEKGRFSSVWTAERLNRFLEQARADGSLKAGRLAMGLSDRTLRRARQRDTTFDAACAAIAAARPMPAQASASASADGAGTAAEAPRRAMRDNAREKARFVAALAEVGGIETAARTLGLRTDTAYAIRDKDRGFEKAWQKARARWIETAESEMLVRAVLATHACPTERVATASRATMQMAGKAKAELVAVIGADPAEAPTAAEATNLEAARLELEQRLVGLVERYGDPFGDDPTRPFLLKAPQA